MNALDKVIGYFSPERAYRRARFRAAAERFAYDGAKSGRRTDGWMAAGGDANTEVGASLISLRNRSRDRLRRLIREAPTSVFASPPAAIQPSVRRPDFAPS